jgi:hypothetical protein
VLTCFYREKARRGTLSTHQYLTCIDAELEAKEREEERRRQTLLAKMRSTSGSNAFTETTSKAKRRKRLGTPEGVDDAGMGNMGRPLFQRQLTKEEIEQILRENPEIAEDFNNERQKWLEMGEEDPNNINPLSDYNILLVSKMQKGYDNKANDLIKNFRNKDFNKQLKIAEKDRQYELDELYLDKLEMQGQAVAFANSEGVVVRKKIIRRKKGKKKGKMFILDTPYGRAKYYKRKSSPPAVEDRNVLFQNTKNLSKKAKAKANKLHGINAKDNSIDRSGSSMVEGDEVMFETGFGPNKLIESDDDIEEGDMVFYNKDDMTNFSKNLGLNKLQSRLSLMSMGRDSERKSFNFEDDGEEDNVAQFDDHGVKRKIIQKRK